MEESLEFVDVVRCVASLGEERVDDEASGATLEDELFLGLHRTRIVRAERDAVIHHRPFVLVSK